MWNIVLLRGSLIGAGEPAVNVIDYVEIATVGNAVDFGDVTLKEIMLRYHHRLVVFLLEVQILQDNLIIEFVTISSKGDAIDFGELTIASGYPRFIQWNSWYSCCRKHPSVTDFIDQITISTTGNAVDFGGTCALAMT